MGAGGWSQDSGSVNLKNKQVLLIVNLLKNGSKSWKKIYHANTFKIFEEVLLMIIR